MKITDEQMVNLAKGLALDSIKKANSGHSGIALSSAEILYTLYTKHLNASFVKPDWINRDRFVMSAGHGSAILYSILHIMGYLTLDDLKNFRQLGSNTPGHPEITTPGIDASTGPLGQGVGNAVGMAMAEAFLDAKYSSKNLNIVNHYTYCLTGDGCLMEGVALESIAIAGHLKLNKLILLYDKNNVTMDAPLAATSSTDIAKMFDSFGWNVINVNDGHDIQSIDNAIIAAKKSFDKPSIIICETKMAHQSKYENSHTAHGKVFEQEEIDRLKSQWGLPIQPFEISEPYAKKIEEIRRTSSTEILKYSITTSDYKNCLPHTSVDFQRALANDVRADLTCVDVKETASTRETAGKCLNRIAKDYQNVVSLSCDVASSTKADIIDGGTFSSLNRRGRNFHLGIREHAMGAIANGIALHGGIKVFLSGFLVFADYMKPALRMAALMQLPVTYLFTHDSINVGEDGPTHQPIEQLDEMRAIPNFNVIRPCDSAELGTAFVSATASKTMPTAIILTRQAVPYLKGSLSQSMDGAYILRHTHGKARAHLIGSGSEVALLSEARKVLSKEGYEVAVISVPSINTFNNMSKALQNRLLGNKYMPRVVVEASSGQAMQKFLGCNGELICMKSFGESAKAEDLLVKYGFTVENIVKTTLQLIKKTQKENPDMNSDGSD